MHLQARGSCIFICHNLLLPTWFACSANASTALTKKLAAAERILKLGELCRKLETEQEKVLPFCTPQQALGLDPLQEGGSPSQQQQPDSMASESSQAESISFDEGDQQVSHPVLTL